MAKTVLLLALLALPCLAQDLINSNNSELTNLDGSKNWVLSNNQSKGDCTVIIKSGSGVPTAGSRFYLDGFPNYYAITVSSVSGTGPVTLTLASPCLPGPYNANTPVYWMFDVSSLKTGYNWSGAGCTPTITQVCVGWTSAHSSDSRVVLSRIPGFVGAGAYAIVPDRWACAVADPCPTTGKAGDSVTTHIVLVKNLWPLLDNYTAAVANYDQIFSGWVVSTRTDNSSVSTLGHLIDLVHGFGSIPTIPTTEANPAGSYGLTIYTWGANQVYQGHSFPIEYATVKTGGPTAANHYISSLTLDDGGGPVACTLTVTIMTCSDNITVQLIPTAYNYQAGNSANDYLYPTGNCGFANKPCNFNADYQIGLPGVFNGVSSGGVTNQSFLRVKTTGSTTAQSYTLAGTFQGATGGSNVGTGASFSYTFTVATPSFSETKATSFPAIYNLVNSQGYMSYFAWQFCNRANNGTPSGENWFNLNGIFENTNYSSSDNSLYFYDGTHWLYEIGDKIATISTDWQSSHSYPYGTLIKPSTGNAGGRVFYTYPTSTGPSTPGGSSTSAGSAPTWPQTGMGATVSDGNGTSYFDTGLASDYNQCGTAVVNAYRHYLNTTQGETANEFNTTFNWGILMDYYRTGDLRCQGSTTAGCPGGTAQTAGDANSLTYTTTNTGATVPHNQYTVVQVTDAFSIRSSAGMLAFATASDLINSTTDTVEQQRVDVMLSILQQGIQIRSFGDTNYLSNAFPLSNAGKAFYVAIVTDSLINWYNKELLANRYHPEIPETIKAYLDWQWANAWNPAGLTCTNTQYNSGNNCAMLYEAADFPAVVAIDFLDPILNQFSAFAYAWMYAITANSTYQTEGDLVFGNSINIPGNMYARKAGSQQRSYMDYIKLRDGTRVSTVNSHVYAEMGVMPDLNPCNSGESFPCTIASTVGDDRIYPMNFTIVGTNALGRQGNPSVSSITGTTASVFWETPEPTAHSQVNVGTASNSCPIQSADVTSYTTISPYRYGHTVPLTGLTPNTTYYVQMQATDIAGNIAKSACGTFGSQYTFRTLNSALQITTVSLASGTQGVAYSQPVTAMGGTPPYSWTIISGSLPTGLSMASTGTPSTTISGTPTGTGTSSFTVQVTDNVSATATQPLSITIGSSSAITITTTDPLPGATIGVPYSTTLAATGGTPPYTWAAVTGALPTGLSFHNATGIIDGTPTVAGGPTYTTYRVTDSALAFTSKPLSITVSDPSTILGIGNGVTPGLGSFTH